MQKFTIKLTYEVFGDDEQDAIKRLGRYHGDIEEKRLQDLKAAIGDNPEVVLVDCDVLP